MQFPYPPIPETTPLKRFLVFGWSGDPKWIEIEDDKKESGTIIQEIQKGFMIKDRLLRPSLVAVSKKSSNKSEDQEKDKKDQQNQQKNEKN